MHRRCWAVAADAALHHGQRRGRLRPLPGDGAVGRGPGRDAARHRRHLRQPRRAGGAARGGGGRRPVARGGAGAIPVGGGPRRLVADVAGGDAGAATVTSKENMAGRLDGMAVGDKKVAEIPADQAYGPRHDEAVQEVPREQIPAEIPLEIGMQLQMQSPTGQVMPVTVVEISDEIVKLDANHMLAGKDLTFAIELVSIN